MTITPTNGFMYAVVCACISILVGLAGIVYHRRLTKLRNDYEEYDHEEHDHEEHGQEEQNHGHSLRNILEHIETLVKHRCTPAFADYLIHQYLRNLCDEASVCEDSIQDEHHCCQVCFEPLKSDNIFDQKRLIGGSFCPHIFHENCLLPWFASHEAICPLCREDMFPEKETDELETLQLAMEAAKARDGGTLPSP